TRKELGQSLLQPFPIPRASIKPLVANRRNERFFMIYDDGFLFGGDRPRADEPPGCAGGGVNGGGKTGGPFGDGGGRRGRGGAGAGGTGGRRPRRHCRFST